MKKALPTGELSIALYFDADGLFKTKVMKILMGALVPIATRSLNLPQKECVELAVTETRELAGAALKDGSGDVLVARLDPAASSKVGPCLAMFGFAPVKVAGAKEAWASGGNFWALSPTGLLINGNPEAVEVALTGRGDGKSLDSVSLERDEYFSWRAQIGESDPPAHGTLLVTEDRVRLTAEGDAPDEPTAQRLAAQFSKSQLSADIARTKLQPELVAEVMRMFDAVDVQRNGRHLALRIELQGSPEQVGVTVVGASSILAVNAMRKYLLLANQAEAKNNMTRLAKALSDRWEKAPAGGKKLASYPAVPKSVPKGAKYASSPADWKAWAPLEFEMTSPQYYQYEIKAAKDGKSADIFARGDLDGNGTASEFKLTVEVRAGHLAVTSDIEEKMPDE